MDGMDAEFEQLITDIGPRLRTLRRDRGLTLEGLSEATGVSVSALSRLESGKRRPTLDLLLPLARAHRVALDQLVGAPATGDPRVHLTPSRRKNGSAVVPLTRYPGRVQVFKQVIGPRPPKLVTHAGYEWLYVLAGDLRLILGANEVLLHPGKSRSSTLPSPTGSGLPMNRWWKSCIFSARKARRHTCARRQKLLLHKTWFPKVSSLHAFSIGSTVCERARGAAFPTRHDARAGSEFPLRSGSTPRPGDRCGRTPRHPSPSFPRR